MSLFKFKSADLCPDKANHGDQPSDYGAASEWADEMLKTHTQHRCPTCGYWTIWKPKPLSAAVPESSEHGA